MWFATAVAGLTVRVELLGVTSPTFPTGPLILEFCRQNLNRIKGR
jgi:hypothetical protein